MPVHKGINFEMKTEGGKQVWYRQNSPGTQCGTDRKWRYEVNVGDTVNQEAGICPNGKKWAK